MERSRYSRNNSYQYRQLIFFKKYQIEITSKSTSVHGSGTTKYPYGGDV